MKYAALLRGINVGGNSMVKMSELKECFEKNGFENVATYINSGNVIFDSEKTDPKSLTKEIEEILSKRFGFDLRIVLRNHSQIQKVIESVPGDWNTRTDLRYYIAFIKEPVTVDVAFAEVEPREGVDFIEKGPGVIYMATLWIDAAKSGITKLIGKKIYKEMTIRNYNTTKKILSLME